jgi:cyclophilin family peptidyl-prolyl cis-trans isomerase
MNKLCIAFAAVLFAAPSLSADPPEALPAAPPATARVRVVSSAGNFVMELNAERAPLTVANFLKYLDAGQYKGTVFHRVITNFVIQGGGYDGAYNLRSATSRVVNESGNGLANSRGTVGLARTENAHSGDCQFYINLVDNSVLDPSAARWGYAVFAKIVEGMDVVDQIGHVATGAAGPFKSDAPLKPILIERIERLAAR